MVTAMNNDETLCGCFGMYPCFVAGILHSGRRIHFLCSVMKSQIMKIILKSLLVIKSVVFCYKSHKDIFPKYHMKAKQFLFRLKLDYFQNYLLN